MLDAIGSLFDSSGFPPRWQCGAWAPVTGWLHIGSDVGVWSAYMAIPAVLGYFVARKKELPFRGLFLLFTAFILACGTTHLMDAVIFWWPGYRLAGVLKFATAVVSWVTVVALVREAPRLLAMPTPDELEREVRARLAAEADLLRANAELEDRVRDRTAALTRSHDALHTERERFRTTLASIGDAVIATDALGRVTFLNPVAESETGWPAAEALGQPLRTVFRIVNETTRRPVENPAERALQDGTVVGLANHTVLIARDGTERPIDDCGAPIRDESGGVVGAVLVFRDITERRRAEEALAEQARLSDLRADVASALAAAQPEADALQACCDALVRHLGAALARVWTLPDGGGTLELRGSAGLYTHLGGRHGRIAVGRFEIGRIAATGRAHATNTLADEPNVSDEGWVREHGLVAFAGYPLVVDGRVVGVLALFARRPLSAAELADLPRSAAKVAQYIDRRRGEARLRASEERFRAFLDHSPAPAWVTEEDGRLAYLSATYHRTFLLAPGEVVGRPVTELYPPALAEVYLRNIRAVADSGKVIRVAEPGVRADGSAGEFLVYTFPLPGPGGRRQVGGVAVDVTELRAAERSVRDSERLLRQVIDTDPNFIVVKDRDGRFTLANRAMADAYGTTPEGMVGKADADFNGAAAEVAGYRAADRRVLDTGDEFHDPDEAFTTAAGERRWLRTTKRPLFGPDGRPAAVLMVAVDVTAQKRLEDQVRQAQKLEAVGQLAGGVAHDFNNLLTVVNGCGELLLTELPPDVPHRPLVEDIIRAGQRGAALTRQLLAFSRQTMLRVETFDPNRVLLETAKLLTRLLGEDVVLKTALDPAAGYVRGDAGQVEQVVINLAVNGRDAMPRGGTLLVETAAADLAAADLPRSPDARPGRFVRLTVTDTGTGMTPEVQARLFEPFFTTKPTGKGTGLGLATVYGIVRQSGGFLTVTSEPGKGTAVAVYLPRHEAEPESTKSGLRGRPRAAGSETILVVEDDESVRALTTAVLQRQGYRVEAAESGAAALAACDRLPAPPDLVLTDVVMPGMSGREVAERLTAKFPRLKVVFLSGYTADAVLRHGVEEERVAFLQKPYTPDTLARFVRDVLDGAADK
jgi:PAS domain S-box-containing protein